MEKEVQRIEISSKTIIFTLLVLFGIWFVIQIKEIILLLFVALIVVSTLHQPVDFLQKRKVPRAIAALLVYLGLMGIFALIFVIIVPPLVQQSQALIAKAPQIFEQLSRLITFYRIPSEDILSEVGNQFGSFGQNLLRVTTGIVAGFIGLVTLFVLSFYLLLEWKKVVSLISSGFAGKQELRIKKLLIDVQQGLGRWMRGELALMFIVGILSYIGLTLLGIPFALPLAVLAGLFEIVAVIGPILSAVPAILAGLLVSPLTALAVAALYFVIQQLENNLIVPTVMSKAVGVNPLATLLALVIGAKLMGIWGAILAVPILVVAKIVITDLLAPEPDVLEEEEEI